MATHSSILAWRIPWTEEPDGLQSLGWQKDKTEATEQAHTSLMSVLRPNEYLPPRVLHKLLFMTDRQVIIC